MHFPDADSISKNINGACAMGRNAPCRPQNKENASYEKGTFRTCFHVLENLKPKLVIQTKR